MSIIKLMTEPVSVQPVGATTKDTYGNAVPGPVGAPVAEFGYLDQKTSVEYLTDRDTAVTRWKAFLFPTSVVTQFATVTFGGAVFQVDGQPYSVYNPRTKHVSHIECVLTEVT